MEDQYEVNHDNLVKEWQYEVCGFYLSEKYMAND
jgi:hypothetical protein